jgi:GT2 family glycosyltransferase
MTVQPFVRVIVINYDGGDVTMRCLDALHKTDWDSSRLEIVVVDNASIDGLDWKIPKIFPHVKLIKSLTNEGFARGNNLAMTDLEGVDFVALINNDTIPETSWLLEQMDVMNSDIRIGAVGAKLLFNKHVIGAELDSFGKFACLTDVRINGEKALHLLQFDERFDRSGIGANSPTPQHWFSQSCSFWIESEERFGEKPVIEVELVADDSIELQLRTDTQSQTLVITKEPQRFTIASSNLGRVINNAGEGMFAGLQGGDIGFKELDLGQRETNIEVFGFCGGAVLLRTEFLHDVGLFDPSFFLYYEDIDLAWRGRLRGWKFWYAPKSVVVHEHSYSSKAGSPFVHFWSDRNRRLTLIKNGTLKVAFKALFGAVLWALRDSVITPLRQIIRLKKPNISASLYRLRQLASLLKAVPTAIKSRRQIGKSRTVARTFISDWISTR